MSRMDTGMGWKRKWAEASETDALLREPVAA